MKTYLATALLVAACGGSSNTTPIDGSGSGSNHADAKVFMDAPPNVPAMITISGVATQQGLSPAPAPGVLVQAFRSSDPNTAVAMATTGSNGAYSLTITTNGQPLDGYIKATKNGNVDLYLYPPAPLVADFNMASLNVLDSGTLGLIYTFSQVTRDTTQATMAVEVMDASMMTVGGATVSSTPASTYRYNGSGSPATPNPAQTSTQPDGIAYLENVPPGSVSVSASKSGATFKTHTVKAFAGAFTTTLVTE